MPALTLHNDDTNTINNTTVNATSESRRKKLSIALWVIQILLAALFLFAGVMKLVMPVEMMNKDAWIPLPGFFLRFIGVAEALGGFGLILPGLTRIATYLTPLAAAGLAIIMVGAVAFSMMDGGFVAGTFPLIVGILTAFVAYGRWRPAPHPGRN